MNTIKKAVCFLLMTVVTLSAHAQATNAEAMDVMRSNGKIYVVVAVVVTVLLGLFLYLINLDRKIGRLEKK
ncbi:MAG: CcmD family protein [Sediminibacterium sp.]|nr:CcmD family protein [Sediminibacterium sp.]